jgi:hypothetical protein
VTNDRRRDGDQDQARHGTPDGSAAMEANLHQPGDHSVNRHFQTRRQPTPVGQQPRRIAPTDD